MKPEIKERWIQALGTYQQATNALHTDEGYCCLGVLCDIYAKEHNINWTEGNFGYSKWEILDNEDILPPEVVEWAGIKSANPILAYSDGCGKMSAALMSDLNDELGFSFTDIAKLIREQL
jgi:hypothetical protein